MRRARAFYVLLLLLFFAGMACGEFVPGQVIVKFKPGVIQIPKGLTVASVKAAAVSAASVRALNAKFEVTALEQLYTDALKIRPDWKHLANVYILNFPAAKEIAQAIKEYKKDANVEFALPNTVVRAFDTFPDDQYFYLQWALNQIKAPQGWDKTTGSAGNLIAVLDTGINYNHQDFAGKVDLVHAKDYVNNDNDPMDDYGHGTAVSGVMGADTNNSIGIAGMDWKAKILPIKVLDNQGKGEITDVNQALAYLAALKSTGTNIVVINMSLGQYSSDSQLQSRCSDAYNQDIVLTAAAGNGNVDWPTYPAYYPTVVAVAATDATDKRAVWTGIDPETGNTQASNYGTWVDISAPGDNIFSTDMSSGYSGNWKGTSLATPYVSGLAALLKAANPALTNSQVVERMKATADNIDSLQDPAYQGLLGTGRINLLEALSGLLVKITSPAGGAYLKGKVDVYGTASGWNFNNYLLEALGNGNLITIETSSVSVESGKLGSWDTAGLNGEYSLRLTALAAGGGSAQTSEVVFIDNLSPEAVISSPLDGAAVSDKVAISGRAKDQYFDHYLLEYGVGSSPSTFQNLGTYYLPVDNTGLGTWETSGLKGPYTLRLTVYDKTGFESIASIGLNVIQTSPTKEIQPQAGLPATFALPNPFVRQTSTAETYFVYNLEGNFNAVIYLFDLNGNLIWQRSYAAGENGGKAGGNQVPWDGRNLYNESVPNGVYLYQVAADKKVIGRGKLIILN